MQIESYESTRQNRFLPLGNWGWFHGEGAQESAFQERWYNGDESGGAKNVSSITECFPCPGTQCFAWLSNPLP